MDTTDPAVQKQLTEGIQKIIGDEFGIKFAEGLGHQAQYDAAKKVITLAATAGFSASNAFHEAFHVIYEHVLTPAQRKQLYKQFDQGAVQAKIKELLEDSPDAWDAATKDPEEMMAYGFQFWHNGLLKLGPDTTTLMGKIARALIKAKAWLLDRPEATQLLQDIADGVYKDGAPSPAEVALAKSQRPWAQSRQVIKAAAEGFGKVWESVLTPFDDRVRGTGNPALDWIAKQMYTQVGERTKQRGFAQVEREMATRLTNELFSLTKDPEYAKGLEDRATGVDSEMSRKIGKFLDDLHGYAKDAGVDMGYVENYLPMAWSGDKIKAKKKEFIDMLKAHQRDIDNLNYDLLARSGKEPRLKSDMAKNRADPEAHRQEVFATLLSAMAQMDIRGLRRELKSREKRIDEADADLQKLMRQEMEMLKKEIAAREADPTAAAAQKKADDQTFKPLTPESIWAMMSNRGLEGTEFSGDAYDANGAPNADFTLNRVFGFLSNADKRPFVRDDLNQGLHRYIRQMVRRAEWARRFGDKNEVWDAKMKEAEKFGLDDGDAKLMQDYKDAALGAKLHNMSPTMRKFISAMTVYQNTRVLAMAVLGSTADPMGIAVRSGDMKEAAEAYKTVLARMTKKGRDNASQIEQLGEVIGAIESSGAADAIASMYGGVDIEGVGKTINDKLFKYNGMNGLNRSTRIAALAAGVRFIEKQPTNGKQGERNLAELGLDPGDVRIVDGSLVFDAKIADALNRFVDESSLRPNVGERTKWGADPTFALLYHLKQFVFSFNKVINKKYEHELLEHGNMTPGLIALSYIPIMAATAMARDAIFNGGSIPEDKGFLHYLSTGYSRSGLAGPSGVAIGAATDGAFGIRNVLGPTADQALDGLGAALNPHNTERFTDLVKESLPGGSVINRL